jgi:hypothetical protein
MVLINTTPLIQEALQVANEPKQDCIDHKQLYRIAKSLKDPKFSYRSLLQNSTFYEPPKVNKEPTKEYIAMMDRAREIIAEKEYYEMTKDITGERRESVWDPAEWRLISNQMTAIFNVLFSIIAVFAAVFYLGELAHVDLGIRVLLGLGGALVVGIAEGWFFTKDLMISSGELASKKQD